MIYIIIFDNEIWDFAYSSKEEAKDILKRFKDKRFSKGKIVPLTFQKGEK